MTEFKNSHLEIMLDGQPIKVIPQEYLEVHAYLLWLDTNKPEGQRLDHIGKAEQFFRERGYRVMPTGLYMKLEDFHASAPEYIASGKLFDDNPEFKQLFS